MKTPAVRAGSHRTAFLRFNKLQSSAVFSFLHWCINGKEASCWLQFLLLLFKLCPVDLGILRRAPTERCPGCQLLLFRSLCSWLLLCVQNIKSGRGSASQSLQVLRALQQKPSDPDWSPHPGSQEAICFPSFSPKSLSTGTGLLNSASCWESCFLFYIGSWLGGDFTFFLAVISHREPEFGFEAEDSENLYILLPNYSGKTVFGLPSL